MEGSVGQPGGGAAGILTPHHPTSFEGWTVALFGRPEPGFERLRCRILVGQLWTSGLVVFNHILKVSDAKCRN